TSTGQQNTTTTSTGQQNTTTSSSSTGAGQGLGDGGGGRLRKSVLAVVAMEDELAAWRMAPGFVPVLPPRAMSSSVRRPAGPSYFLDEIGVNDYHGNVEDIRNAVVQGIKQLLGESADLSKILPYLEAEINPASIRGGFGLALAGQFKVNLPENIQVQLHARLHDDPQLVSASARVKLDTEYDRRVFDDYMRTVEPHVRSRAINHLFVRAGTEHPPVGDDPRTFFKANMPYAKTDDVRATHASLESRVPRDRPRPRITYHNLPTPEPAPTTDGQPVPGTGNGHTSNGQPTPAAGPGPHDITPVSRHHLDWRIVVHHQHTVRPESTAHTTFTVHDAIDIRHTPDPYRPLPAGLVDAARAEAEAAKAFTKAQKELAAFELLHHQQLRPHDPKGKTPETLHHTHQQLIHNRDTAYHNWLDSWHTYTHQLDQARNTHHTTPPTTTHTTRTSQHDTHTTDTTRRTEQTPVQHTQDTHTSRTGQHDETTAPHDARTSGTGRQDETVAPQDTRTSRARAPHDTHTSGTGQH
ncbi:MAG: hypothetical protein DIU71_18980, partial [Proteobacteria bacterium]